MPPDSPGAAVPGMRAQLADAAAALHWPLADAQATLLLAYIALLQRWNRVYNLTALRSADTMFSHHLLDCLAVMPAVQRHCTSLLGQPVAAGALVAPQQSVFKVLDVGSGGGLPGVVMAVLQPSWQVHCLDAVAKKVGFIRQVAAELQLCNLQGLHTQVQALERPVAGYALITSRAFASLADFTALTAHLLADGGVWMAMKGKLPVEEQAALPADVEVFHVEQLHVPGLHAQRCLVWMRPRTREIG